MDTTSAAANAGIAALVFSSWIFTLLFLVGMPILYMLPWIVSRFRKRPNQTAIALLNFFLGWTLIGWVVALVWASTESKPEAVAVALRTCLKCGAQMPIETRFCPQCGAARPV